MLWFSKNRKTDEKKLNEVVFGVEGSSSNGGSRGRSGRLHGTYRVAAFRLLNENHWSDLAKATEVQTLVCILVERMKEVCSDNHDIGYPHHGSTKGRLTPNEQQTARNSKSRKTEAKKKQQNYKNLTFSPGRRRARQTLERLLDWLRGLAWLGSWISSLELLSEPVGCQRAVGASFNQKRFSREILKNGVGVVTCEVM